MRINIKQRDTVIDGTIAGLFGALGADIIHTFALFLFHTIMVQHDISQLIFPNKDVTETNYMKSSISK
ncbi:MAG: hypothetical protein ACOWWO_08630 [Peptococcaceae bacterium]